jgi:hypothetical protein
LIAQDPFEKCFECKIECKNNKRLYNIWFKD